MLDSCCIVLFGGEKQSFIESWRVRAVASAPTDRGDGQEA